MNALVITVVTSTIIMFDDGAVAAAAFEVSLQNSVCRGTFLVHSVSCGNKNTDYY